jgi:sulfate adenylyltransferase subunit 1 (EFTu-like GTPase family)
MNESLDMLSAAIGFTHHGDDIDISRGDMIVKENNAR